VSVRGAVREGWGRRKEECETRNENSRVPAILAMVVDGKVGDRAQLQGHA
jgi:hypothetical protein